LALFSAFHFLKDVKNGVETVHSQKQANSYLFVTVLLFFLSAPRFMNFKNVAQPHA